MNMISDYEAHKRDEEVKMPSLAGVTRCGIHGTAFVLGVGVGHFTKLFGPKGGCSECFQQTEEWRQMLKESA